jgi:DNA primase
VAEGALRGAGGRPNVLVRYADGIHGEFFYQKRAPAARPDWIEVVALQFPSGRTAEEVVPRDAAALAWMANLGCLELHPHPCARRTSTIPDELRIDLDPVPGWSGPRSSPSPASCTRCSRTSGSWAGPRRRARAASTSTCAFTGAGRSRR